MVIRRALVACVLVSLLPSLLRAETRTIRAKPGLVQLSVPSPDDVDVSWESQSPYDLEFFVFRLSSGETVVVFQLTGERVVVRSDSIDWEARSRKKITWLVEADPEPDPELTAFGVEVQRRARSIQDADAVAKVADNFAIAAASIESGSLASVSRARSFVVGRNEDVPLTDLDAWTTFGAWLGDQLNKRAQTLDSTKDAFLQISAGIKASLDG